MATTNPSTITAANSGTRYSVRISNSEILSFALKNVALLTTDPSVKPEDRKILVLILRFAYDYSIWFQSIAACIVDCDAFACRDRKYSKKMADLVKQDLGRLLKWYTKKSDEDDQKSVDSETSYIVWVNESNVMYAVLSSLAKLAEDTNVSAHALHTIQCIFQFTFMCSFFVQFVVTYLTGDDPPPKNVMSLSDDSIALLTKYVDRIYDQADKICTNVPEHQR